MMKRGVGRLKTTPIGRKFLQETPPLLFLNKKGRGVYMNYNDMSYDELQTLYIDLLDELSFVNSLLNFRNEINAGNQASAEIHTEELIRRCKA